MEFSIQNIKYMGMCQGHGTHGQGSLHVPGSSNTIRYSEKWYVINLYFLENMFSISNYKSAFLIGYKSLGKRNK